MKYLFGGLLLLIASVLQVTLMGRFSLLAGTADLLLLVMLTYMLQEDVRADWRWGIAVGLMVDLSSALPIWVSLAAYVGAAALAQLLETRVWKIPLLTLFGATLGGTLLIQAVTMFYLWLNASPINFAEAFNLVTLPSMLLNLLLVLPVSAVVSEFSKLALPSQEIL
jgi:cell shape-determining protein MreD